MAWSGPGLRVKCPEITLLWHENKIEYFIFCGGGGGGVGGPGAEEVLYK